MNETPNNSSLTRPITREEVHQVADRLFARGQRVTQEKVRQELKRGSYGTINKYLKEWKEIENPIENTNIIEPIPDDIIKDASRLFQGLLNRLWMKALTIAEYQVNNARILVLENENEELRNDLMKYETLEQKFKVMEQTNENNQAKLIETIERQSKENAELSEKIRKLEVAFNELTTKMHPDSNT